MPHKRDGPASQATTAGPQETRAESFLPLPELPRKAFPPAPNPPPEPIRVIVDGTAVAKGRPRFVRKTGIAFTPSHVRKYEAAARFAASVAMAGRPPLSGPVRLELVVELPIPTSWSRKRTLADLAGAMLPATRPDLDNYVKSALDAINTIVVGDDCQVVELHAYKRFSDHPKLTATVYAL